MEFTVELRYHGGSSTVLSVEAEHRRPGALRRVRQAPPARGDHHHRPRRDGGRGGAVYARASDGAGLAATRLRNASTGTESAAVTRYAIVVDAP